LIGRQLSHYRVIAPLGSGGMGTVFRAEDTLLGRPVALKFPLHGNVPTPEERERFLHEARSASVLDHPNIVVLYDVCEVGDEVFLAMQCVEGRPLRERLAAGPLPLADTLAIGRAVADALAHAHGRGVVHRDIKPDNILLDAEGRVKVADFGTALMIGAARLTETGVVVGTASYVAPEVLRGRTADGRSDLYSLGVILYEACAGTLPFHGETMAALLYKVAHTEAPPLPEGTRSPALRSLVMSLLAKSPEQRPVSAVAVSDALSRIQEGSGSVNPPRDAAPAARTIGVLDFENVTRDPSDDYFCVGITEDLLTELLKVPDLQVASRTMVSSLSSNRAEAWRAFRDAGIGTLLTGGVRRAGQRVRVTAQLVRTDTGYQLWADRYDRELEDIFDVQEDISRRITGALHLALSPVGGDTRAGRRTSSARAYDLRLRAVAAYRQYEEVEMRRAIDLLEQAVKEDPAYALARADLAEACVQMACKNWDMDLRWLDKAEAETHTALALAPDLPEAYRALGHAKNHRGRMRAAIQDFERAVELDPNYAGGLIGLGANYLYFGDPGRAEVYFRRALNVDPEEVRAKGSFAATLLFQGRVAESRDYARRALTGDVSDGTAITLHEILVMAAGREKDEGELRRLAESLRHRFDHDDRARAVRALAAAILGDRETARALLRPMPGESTIHVAKFVARGRAYACLGDRDAALTALERALEIDLFLNQSELRHDPWFATLHDDPRFARLLAEPG
jgi:serine/threonine protein kinase/tetratricopeptide (TPR) repeat protein